MHFRVAARTQRQHLVQNGMARLAVVHRDRALAATTRPTDAAGVTVPLQYELAQTAEVLRILSPEGVADGAHAIGQDLLPSTSAIECSLLLSAHLSPLILS